MAYDDKTLKRDGSGITPTPQHFNPTSDDYEPLYGRNNASRVELYGDDGNPISVDSGKLEVKAGGLETLLSGVDFATQTTLAAILAKIIAAPATAAKQDTIIGHIDGLEALLTAQAGKELFGATTATRPLATAVAVGTTFTLTNANLDTWISDGISWVVI